MPVNQQLETGIALSKVAMPWASATNPHSEEYLRQAEETARRVGLIREEGELIRFRGFVQSDTYVYPYATLERIAAAGAYSQWLFFLDDQYDDNPELGQNVPRVNSIMRRAFDVLRTGALPQSPTEFELFSQDVHKKLSSLAPLGWMERLINHTKRYLFEGSLRSMALWASGVPASTEEYMRVREWDSGVHGCLDCAALAADSRLLAEVYSHPSIEKLAWHTVRHVAFLNDLVSYQKEVLRNGYTSNLVFVLSQERSLNLADAAAASIEIINRDLCEFQETEKSLPSFGSDLDSQVQRYVGGMKTWMRGNYDFSLRSRRYRALDSPFLELRHRTVSLEMLTSTAVTALGNTLAK